jgi:hypothetical protein
MAINRVKTFSYQNFASIIGDIFICNSKYFDILTVFRRFPVMSIEFLKAFSLGCWNGYVFGGSFLSHHHYFCGHPIALGTESAFVLAWSRNDLSGFLFLVWHMWKNTHLFQIPIPLPLFSSHLFVLLQFLRKKKN